jgi:hypothetical protein
MRANFEAMGKGRKAATVARYAIFSFMDIDPHHEFVDWLIKFISPQDPLREKLIFSEYVNCICFFCMVGSREFTKFMFAAMDEEKRGYLS